MRTFQLEMMLMCVVVLCYTLYQTKAEMDARDYDEYRLNYDLFKGSGYNNLIRPVVNTSDTLQINFSLALSAIINVDEKNQVIITNVWLQMYWIDYQLVWNVEDYGNITQIKVDHAYIWTPEVVLFNNADGKFEPSYNPNCVVEFDGDVKFIPPAIYTSSCTIDVEYFPFDQQNCEMKFGSWTFEGKTLSYSFQEGFNKLDLWDYMKNGAWDIIDCPGHISTTRDAMGQIKEIIVYELVLRRKTLFYTVNLIIPCFLHALVCLCVFVLPADGCEKITLVISVLVSLVVFLLVLQKILPPSITIPLIAKYFIFTFIMNVLEILVTVAIIFANHKTPGTDVMPRWMCWLLLYKLPKYVFMERPDHDNRWQPKSCTPPPSYPNTPQVPRANIFMRQPDPPERKKKPVRPTKLASTSSDSREANRVLAWRQKFSKSHSPGISGLTMSSSASGSHLSTDDSPTIEMREFPPPPHFSTDGHKCMLRDSGTSQSDDSLDGATSFEGGRHLDVVGPVQPNIARVPPLVLTREVYSASNAIKFICHQMQNQEDYNTVLDDWKYVAAVLDRLLMVIFILVSLGGTLGVLFNAPYILETVDQDEIIERIKNGG